MQNFKPNYIIFTLFFRFNLMFRTPRRLTMEKMASKRFNSQNIINRRMVISMPNLQDIKLPESPTRKSSLRRIETGIGEWRMCWTNMVVFFFLFCMISLNDFHKNSVKCWKEMVSWVIFCWGPICASLCMLNQPVFCIKLCCTTKDRDIITVLTDLMSISPLHLNICLDLPLCN